MQKKKHKIVNIPILNDFVYTALFNASYQEKRGLTGRYLKAAMNEKAAKQFCVHSSREEKEFILSYLGYEYCYIIYKNSSSFDKLKEIIADKNPTVQRITTITAEGVYLHSDKEFQRYLGLTSQNLHHYNFQFNNEIVRNHYNVMKWKKTFQNNIDIEAREVDESVRQTAKFLFHATIVMDNLLNLIGVSSTGIKILLYLYQMKELSIKREALQSAFAGYLSKNELNSVLRILVTGNFISSLRTFEGEERPWTYSITTIGIRTVNNYFNHIYNQNSF